MLDRLTSRVREIFNTPICAITLIDRGCQRAVSSAGQLEFEIPRSESFCDMTIRRAEHFAVEDASLDSRYRHFRSVLTGPRVRFYAGYPLESSDGERVGVTEGPLGDLRGRPDPDSRHGAQPGGRLERTESDAGLQLACHLQGQHDRAGALRIDARPMPFPRRNELPGPV